MKLNLRKANAIQTEIRRAISALEAKDSVSVTEYTDDVVSVVSSAETLYAETMFRKEALTVALYNIRKSVAVANANAGVGEILGDIEKFDQIIKLLETTINVRTRQLSVDEISKRIEKMRNIPADSVRVYGRNEEVMTGVVSDTIKGIAKGRIKEMRKARQELQDKLLTINVTTEINIDDVDAQVLGEEGIL